MCRHWQPHQRWPARGAVAAVEEVLAVYLSTRNHIERQECHRETRPRRDIQKTPACLSPFRRRDQGQCIMNELNRGVRNSESGKR